MWVNFVNAIIRRLAYAPFKLFRIKVSIDKRELSASLQRKELHKPKNSLILCLGTPIILCTENINCIGVPV